MINKKEPWVEVIGHEQKKIDRGEYHKFCFVNKISREHAEMMVNMFHGMKNKVKQVAKEIVSEMEEEQR